MFIIILRLSENRASAPQFMEEHRAWLQRGFDEGAFLVAGTIEPREGGAIVANGGTREDIERRVSEDPFVIERVASAEILEISPARTDERLSFLLAN